MSKIFLTAAWRDLVMLNYDVDPALLAPLAPRGCELDDFGGRHLVSVVGFRFLQTRVLGVAIPWHRDFLEVNLRFYVRRHESGQVKRGVVFIKEVVPRWAVTLVARRVYNENYVTCPMNCHVVPPRNRTPGSAAYRWQSAGRWNEVVAETAGPSVPCSPGSEEEFITEHYWGYTRQRDGGTIEYEVQHPRWRIWPTTASRLTIEPAFYGDEFMPALQRPPSSAFLVDGSAVQVMRGRALAFN